MGSREVGPHALIVLTDLMPFKVQVVQCDLRRAEDWAGWHENGRVLSTVLSREGSEYQVPRMQAEWPVAVVDVKMKYNWREYRGQRIESFELRRIK